MKIEFNIETVEYKGNRLLKRGFNNVLNTIVNGMLYSITDKNGYVDIYYKIFESGTYKQWNYKEYIDYLVVQGCIKRSPFIKGKKSFGYRLEHNFILNLKITKLISEDSDVNLDMIGKSLFGDIDLVDYKLDTKIDDKILNMLLIDFKDIKIDYNYDLIEKEWDKWDNFILTKKWFNNNVRLFRWYDGHSSFNLSRGRLYSSFTNLSSSVRKKHIYLNNENLEEFDISSSYLLMLCLFSMKIEPSLKTDYDFKTFCTHVINKDIYKKLTGGLNEIRNSNTTGNEQDDETDVRLISRNETKEVFQRWLNGEKDNVFINGINVNIGKYMEMKYTCIYDIVQRMKKYVNTTYDTMVVIETQYIMHVVKKLYEEISDVKILTCHDAIYVQESLKNEVGEIWDREFDGAVRNLPYEKYEPVDNNEVIEYGAFKEKLKVKEPYKEKDKMDLMLDKLERNNKNNNTFIKNKQEGFNKVYENEKDEDKVFYPNFDQMNKLEPLDIPDKNLNDYDSLIEEFLRQNEK